MAIRYVQEGKGSLARGHRAGESWRREGSVGCIPGTWLVSWVGMGSLVQGIGEASSWSALDFGPLTSGASTGGCREPWRRQLLHPLLKALELLSFSWTLCQYRRGSATRKTPSGCSSPF